MFITGDATVTVGKNADVWLIDVNDYEYCRIPDAVISGGGPDRVPGSFMCMAEAAGGVKMIISKGRIIQLILPFSVSIFVVDCNCT